MSRPRDVRKKRMRWSRREVLRRLAELICPEGGYGA